MKQLLIKPLITEKTLFLASRGWYTFAADTLSRKEQLVNEIQLIYPVHVVSVRTIAMHGKVRRSGSKGRTHRLADWKKVLVQLAKGEKIDAFDIQNFQQPVEEEARPAVKAIKAPTQEEKEEVKQEKNAKG